MNIVPNLDEMTDEQKLAALESIQKSIAESKELQKQKIAANVDLVVQALKRIDSDIRSRFEDVGNAIEKRVASIKDGRDGINGKDGRDGKDGKSGKDGAVGPAGRDGIPGRDGVDGVNGVGVTSARIDFDGSLIISLDNGREINVGEVVAPDLAERIKVITNGGGTSQYVLDTLTSLQNQINSIGGGLSYQGTWNATTNTPTLASSTGTNGYYYIVATAGSTNLNGITDWKIGDWLLFNGSVWQKIDQSETLQSITSSDGSIIVTTTGSTADLSVSQTSPASVLVEQVRNSTGATLTKGTAVYISGATGQLPTVSKALATSDSTSAQTLGLITTDLANNSNGYVTIIGLISNLDTSAYTDGAQLYLSPTTAGTLTATKPYAPQHLVYVAVVAHAHPTQGKLLVKVQNGYELDELHNVSAQSPSNGQTILWNGTTSLWEKANLTGTASQVTVTNGAGSVTLSLPSTINVNTSGSAASLSATLVATSGGTGQSSYAVGDLLYASTTTALSKLADVATGNALISGGVGVAPSYGKIALTTHVSGTLPVANGGTNLTSFTANGVVYASSTSALATGSALVFDGSNLGVGVTPSAWSIGTAIQVKRASFYTYDNSGVEISQNAAVISGAWQRIGADFATKYAQDTGKHYWFTAPSSTAGSVITWTQSMTLDASNNLSVTGTATATKFIPTGSSATGNGIYLPAANSVGISTNGAERFRMNASGSAFFSGNYTVDYPGSGNTSTGIYLESAGQLCVSRDNTVAGRFNRNSSDGTLISCARQGTEVGTIGVTTSATSYNTSSDYRLKNTIAPMTGALAKVAALKPVTYKWNVDGSDGEGFIAHELAAVCPHAVTGEKDGTQMQPYEITPAIAATYDADGIELTPFIEAVMGEREVPKYQGIDTSFLVATLTAAIQEQQALITQLTARITALEDK
jgi:hypothetical protein